MHMYSEMSHYVNGSYTQVSMQRFDYKYYLEIATIPPKVRLWGGEILDSAEKNAGGR